MNIDFQLNGVDPLAPLLYKIAIGGMVCYIGCANSARRPKSAYRRNLQRMIDGRPYRKGDQEGFRLVHKRLLEATNSGETIVIELIRNVPRESKFSEERAEIQRHLDNGEILLNDRRRHRM